MILDYFELFALFYQFDFGEHTVVCLHDTFGKSFFLYFFHLLFDKLATPKSIFIDY